MEQEGGKLKPGWQRGIRHLIAQEKSGLGRKALEDTYKGFLENGVDFPEFDIDSGSTLEILRNKLAKLLSCPWVQSEKDVKGEIES